MKQPTVMKDKPRPNPPARRLWLFRAMAFGIPTIAGLACLAGWLIHRGRLEVDVAKMSISLKDEPIYVYDQHYQESGHRYLFDENLGWRNVPNDRGHTFSFPATINSHGLRGPERPFEKPGGTQRILILGDSFPWGYAVGDHDVCAPKLEDWLQKRDANVEVLNAAVSGWSTDQEYLYLRDEGFRYSPDAVVLAFYVVNDFLENTDSVQHGHRKPIFLDAKLTLAGHPVPKLGGTSPPSKSKAHPVDLATAIVSAMAKFCEQHGCRLVVMKFGSIFFPGDPELSDFAGRFEKHVSQLSDVVYFDFDAVCEGQGLKGPDLFAGNPGGHWNPRAHGLAAESLGKLLLDKNLIHRQMPAQPAR